MTSTFPSAGLGCGPEKKGRGYGVPRVLFDPGPLPGPAASLEKEKVTEVTEISGGDEGI